MKILVTGGAGFIGSALVRKLVEDGEQVVTVDSLSYAGNLANLATVDSSPLHSFYQVDIRDIDAVRRVVLDEAPDAIMHLAAESHVDRSIDSPDSFIQTNVMGTFNLLEIAREYASGDFRFLHVSTDEVYGSLGDSGRFSETSPYDPNSPYSASKAASDHLVRAWYRTYGLPTLITNCSNNFGPYQFPEKLLPLVIMKAVSGDSIPIYGDGLQVRDWLYVDDHVEALKLVLTDGRPGETYNIGGHGECTNRDVVGLVLDAVNEVHGKPRDELEGLLTRVADRPGHDRRYAIDPDKIESELGWEPTMTLAEGVKQTVAWYGDNEDWCRLVSNVYNGERLGGGSA